MVEKRKEGRKDGRKEGREKRKMERRRDLSWCSGQVPLGLPGPVKEQPGPRPLRETGPGRGQHHGFLLSAKSLARVSDCNRFSRKIIFSCPAACWHGNFYQDGPAQDSWKSRFKIPCYHLRRLGWEARPAGVGVHQRSCAPWQYPRWGGELLGKSAHTPASFLLPLSRQLTFDLSAPWSV